MTEQSVEEGEGMTGWLTKEGAKFKTWKKRWFVLDEPSQRLYYYAKQDVPADKFKGYVTLDDATCAIALGPEAKGGRKNLFSIVTPSRTWYLSAETPASKERWLRKVQSMLDKAAPEKPATRASVTTDDFELLKVIGKGNFGKVMLVRMKGTEEIYAMKMLSKQRIIERNEIEHTMAECRILQRLRHPFLVNLHYAFQTEDKLYLILDFVNGGELFFHLTRETRFKEERVKFYAAEILLGLEYLHNAGVLYRDLKLENLLLTSEGHIVLTDFGLSKQGLDGTDARTATFCGTPEYMAPEMLSGKPYGKAVDWWSFGSLLFEMLTGLPPFYSRDIQEMYRRIVTERLQFPPYVSDTARSIIYGLLEKDPSRRTADPETLKEHPFFDGIDWDMLYRKRIPPPFVPPVNGPTDLSQFDKSFTDEMPSLDMTDMPGDDDDSESEEENEGPEPTEEEKKQAFREFTYTSPEHEK